VEDNFSHKTDGTAISTHRFREELVKRGHTVRVIGIGIDGPDMYGVKEHVVPLVSAVARKNNMHFGLFDEKIIREAFTGADVVHLIFPWQIEQKCLKLARRMGIPVSGAFHCQPENVTYNMMIKLLGVANTFIYFLFRIWMYRHIENIHCPSRFAAGELQKHGYHARLHAISNGISDSFKPAETEVVREDGAINVLMVGRLAEEKRQDLVIKAVKQSKYRDRIQISFVGRGPMYKRYLRQTLGLPNPPRFFLDFIPHEQLVDLIYKTDVYIHASEVELECISCLEAIACARVPVIANSNKSAAPQFALDGRSLFKKGDFLDLRDKLDYWIEHPGECKKMEGEYAALGRRYNISYSVKKMEQMFESAVTDFRTRQMINGNPRLRKYARLVEQRASPLRVFSFLFHYVIAAPLLTIAHRVYFDLKYKNKKVLNKVKHTGVITICNHVHYLDGPICIFNIFPRRPLTVSLPRNFDMALAGLFVTLLGAVPSPSTPKELQSFIYLLSKHLRRRGVVHFFPEGELDLYHEGIREFQRGAFYLAVDAQVPVLPLRLVYREPRGIYRLLKKKHPCFTLVHGEPLYPDTTLLKKDAVADLQKRAEEAMRTLG
jgi:glycosyltransferase involved in cell wall biosynthesis/1-acyl-sn-glycerol-3-phosphate acyltransferase